jgi:hypothetical protein
VANGFSKEEIVAFDQVLEAFDDSIVATKMARVYRTNQETMERTNDTIWRPMPYIMTSYTGNDMTSNFKDVTQLSVPSSINVQKSVPFTLTAKQLRDQLQEGRLGLGARQKLASDINVSLTATAAAYGSIVVKRTGAATGFDDLALCDSTMTVLGIQEDGRVYGASPSDYNNMASNLASRVLDNSKSLKAYERAYIGQVAGFDTYKLNYAQSLAAKTATTVKITNTNPLYYTPAATVVSADGLTYNNVDNRFQTISITVGGSTVKVGDAFTIAGVNACHHITKQDTGLPKTFRVVAIVTGAGGSGTIQITPPIISNGGATPAEAQYQNVTATPANNADLTFLNTVTGYQNVFWAGDCMEILPGRLMPATDSGMAVMRGTTDDGIELVMTRQGAINDLTTKYRFDTLYGTVCLNPEMAGIELFSQT